jgi:hypothetical protein
LSTKDPTKTQETDVNTYAPKGYTVCFSYNTHIITSFSVNSKNIDIKCRYHDSCSCFLQMLKYYQEWLRTSIIRKTNCIPFGSICVHIRFLCFCGILGAQHLSCSVLCGFSFSFFVFVLCPVFLDCPLLIVPTIFSNVY